MAPAISTPASSPPTNISTISTTSRECQPEKPLASREKLRPWEENELLAGIGAWTVAMEADIEHAVFGEFDVGVEIPA